MGVKTTEVWLAAVIQAEIKAAVDDAIEDAQKEIVSQVRSAVAAQADRIALKIMRRYSIMSFGDEIVIRVDKVDLEEKQ
jgi:hypothetical protein